MTLNHLCALSLFTTVMSIWALVTHFRKIPKVTQWSPMYHLMVCSTVNAILTAPMLAYGVMGCIRGQDDIPRWRSSLIGLIVASALLLAGGVWRGNVLNQIGVPTSSSPTSSPSPSPSIQLTQWDIYVNWGVMGSAAMTLIAALLDYVQMMSSRKKLVDIDQAQLTYLATNPSENAQKIWNTLGHLEGMQELTNDQVVMKWNAYQQLKND